MGECVEVRAGDEVNVRRQRKGSHIKGEKIFAFGSALWAASQAYIVEWWLCHMLDPQIQHTVHPSTSDEIGH